MSQIKALLWDIDGTVLNFEASERAAIRKGFALFGLGECTDEMIREYSMINVKYWEKLERGELTKDRVLEGRFEEFFTLKGIDISVAAPFNAEYQKNLAEVICFEPFARELIWEYQGKYRQYAASNGTALAQRTKLRNSGLDQIFDSVFISDEIGVEKPMAGFFDAALAEMKGLDKSEIMIIGDSLTSDMRGGDWAGIVTCWYNPKGKKNTLGVRVDYEISSLEELPGVLESR